MTVPTQVAIRSGGSSLIASTSTARTRAVESSRPYSSDTKLASEYDVIIVSTLVQSSAKFSSCPTSEAATSCSASASS